MVIVIRRGISTCIQQQGCKKEPPPVLQEAPLHPRTGQDICWLNVESTLGIHIYVWILSILVSGGNIFKNRPRPSMSEYKWLPINLRLFQNTVKLLDNFFLMDSTAFASTELSLMLPVPMLDKDCLKFGNMELEESESEWFQMYSGTF